MAKRSESSLVAELLALCEVSGVNLDLTDTVRGVVHQQAQAYQNQNPDPLIVREYLLAGILKSLCNENGEETDVKQSAKIIYQLGKAYRQRSPDKRSLIRSAVLFNAALVREPDNTDEIRADLNELCSHLLQHAGVDFTVACLTDKVNEISHLVRVMRQIVQNGLHEINALQCGEFESKNDRCQRAKLIEKLQQEICERYTMIMNSIMDHCLLMKGKLPCRYALAGMGSLARKDVTPYSDFEHVILLEEGVQSRSDYEEILEYFRWVSVLFQFILINLGETIIPCINLPCLNDWFYDGFTKRGICFDGMLPHACKFPLGRPVTHDKPWTTELIKPVKEMLSYLKCEEDLKNGYHLADILTKTCFVSGSEMVYKQFLNGVREYSEELNCGQLRQQVEEDLKNFNPVCNLNHLQRGSQLNVKRMIFRTTSLFIAALARLYNLKSRSSFDVVRELGRLGKLDEDFVHSLLYCSAVACEVRLKVYAEQNRQDDRLKNNLEKEFEVPLVQLLGAKVSVFFFQTAMRLQREVSREIGLDNVPYVQQMAPLDKLLSCFWLQLRDEAVYEAERLLAHVALLQEPTVASAVAAVLSAVGDFLFRGDCARKALKCYELFEQVASSDEETAYCLNRRARCFHFCGEFSKALPCFKLELLARKQMSTVGEGEMQTDLDVLCCYFNIGQCWYGLGLYDKALNYFNQAKTGCQNMERRSSADNAADCENMIAKCMVKQAKYNDAVAHYNGELKFREQIGRRSFLSVDKANCCFDFGKTYFNLEDYGKASEMFEKSKTIWSDIDQKLTTLNPSNCMTVFCTYRFGLMKNRDDVIYLKEEFDIKQDISCVKASTLSATIGLNNIEHFQFRHQELQVSFQFCENTSKMSEPNAHDRRQRSAAGHASVTEESNRATEMDFDGESRERIPGPPSTRSITGQFRGDLISDSNREGTTAFACVNGVRVEAKNKAFLSNVAVCTKMIGRCVFRMRNYKKALEHFTTELKLRRRLSDDPRKDLAIALCYINQAGCFVKLGQFENAVSLLGDAKQVYVTSAEATAKRNVPECVRVIGSCMYEGKRYRNAIESFQEELEIRRSMHGDEDHAAREDRVKIAECLSMIGNCFFELKQHGQALRHYDEELTIRIQGASGKSEDAAAAFCLFNAAQCHLSRKDFVKAAENYQKAKALWLTVDRTESRKNVTVCLRMIAECLYELKNYEESRKYLLEEIRNRKQISDDESKDLDMASCYTMFAITDFRQAKYANALMYFELAKKIYSNCVEANAKRNLAECIKMEGMCFCELQMYDEAMTQFNKELELRREFNGEADTARDIVFCNVNLAHCYHKIHRLARASQVV